MIDLSKFVADEDNPRTWMHNPVNIGRETVATNGHILIAVPKIFGYQAADKNQRQNFNKFLKNFPSKKIFVDMPGYYTHKEYKCGMCKGTGKQHKDVGGEYEYELIKVEPEQVCGTCDGTLISVVMVKMDVPDRDIYFDLKYLAMIRDHPGLKVKFKDERMLWWISDISRGCLMAMRP